MSRAFVALRDAARALEVERTIRALARSFALWREPGSDRIKELASRQDLFSAQVLTRGIALGLEEWTSQALLEWVERERRPPCQGPELAAVFVAGSIPTNAFALITAPLLAGSAVWVHPPRNDPHTLVSFLATLREQDPDVAAAVAIDSGPSALPYVDAVIAEGRDETLRELRAAVAPETLFVGYGHKLSLAAIGHDASLVTAVRALALDVALFDGRGCLSPAYVIVEDTPRGRAEDLAQALASELARLRDELPRGSLGAAEHVALRDLRARWSTRAGAKMLLAPSGTDWAVALLPFEAELPPPGTLRHVPVIAVSDTAGFLHAVSLCAPSLSALAHAGWDLPRAQLARAALRAGASRICELGHMQRPPIGWRHDGRGAIEVLLRFIDIEPAPSQEIL